jgi:hypothetical protein
MLPSDRLGRSLIKQGVCQNRDDSSEKDRNLLIGQGFGIVPLAGWVARRIARLQKSPKPIVSST